MSTFDHKDGRLIGTAQLGAPTSHLLQPFPLLSVISVKFDPGGKSSYGKQFSQTPYAILTGSAEPKLTVELSDASEGWAFCEWVGGIGAKPIVVSHVFTRIAVPSQNFLFLGCSLTNGAGYDSDDSKGVVCTLEFMLKDCWKNGKTIYV